MNFRVGCSNYGCHERRKIDKELNVNLPDADNRLHSAKGTDPEEHFAALTMIDGIWYRIRETRRACQRCLEKGLRNHSNPELSEEEELVSP